MKTNYPKVIGNLSAQLAQSLANIAIIQDLCDQQQQVINDQKIKHPEDFPADKQKKGGSNAKKIQD